MGLNKFGKDIINHIFLLKINTLIIIIMSDQWTTVSNKKIKSVKNTDALPISSTKKKYLPPPLRKKSIKNYPKMKFPQLWKDIRNFKEQDLKQDNLLYLYFSGNFYDNNGKQLNSYNNLSLKNSECNIVVKKLKKFLEMISKFKRINNKNEETAFNLLSELKQLYQKLDMELKKIKFEDAFYHGNIYDNNGNAYTEINNQWDEEKLKYQQVQSQKNDQWKVMLEKSKITPNKKFTDLFKNN
jgi:hypothetical protein